MIGWLKKYVMKKHRFLQDKNNGFGYEDNNSLKNCHSQMLDCPCNAGTNNSF